MDQEISTKVKFVGGVICAFMAGLLFTGSSALVKFKTLDFEDCMFARYLLQFIAFLVCILNVKNGVCNENNISFWVWNVDDDKNIRTIRLLLIFQGIFGALDALGGFISAILMPVGDSLAICYSSSLPTMIFAKLFLGTKLKLYKISCGLCVITGIIFGSKYN